MKQLKLQCPASFQDLGCHSTLCSNSCSIMQVALGLWRVVPLNAIESTGGGVLQHVLDYMVLHIFMHLANLFHQHLPARAGGAGGAGLDAHGAAGCI